MGAITVITSGKGGVGKSTVTAGLGLALCERGKRVLLIDTDAGLGCLDHMLDISEQMVFDIADVVSGQTEPMDAVYSCPFCRNLFLLPAPANEEDIVSPDIMKQLISLYKGYYDHIIIDSPAGIGAGFLSSISCAERALVVSTADPVCLKNTNRTRLILDKAGIKQQRLIINRFSVQNFYKQGYYKDLDEVINAAGIRLIAVIPEDTELMASAVNSSPCLKKSAGIMALSRLAARLEGENIPLALLKK